MNPDLTNGEVAAKTETRVPLVRDTISAYEADDTEESTDAVPETERDECTAEIDSDAFSETQIEILETALASPELTNAEIADKTGTRITLVRDTIFEHRYDKKPWASDLDEETDDSAESGDDGVDVAEPDDKEIEIPDTTAADAFSTAQRSVLETALKNPKLTNTEIAEQTGTRLTLVRDTRATYADSVALAEDDQNDETTATESESKPESKASERTLSDTQRAILEAAANDSGQTNAEIAEKTGTRLTLVRDTREQYEDEIDLADDTDTTTSPSETHSEDTGSTGDTDVGSTTDTTTESPESTEADGPRSGLLVGILLVILLALGLGVAVGAI